MLTTTANPVFFRTYSRHTPNGRETWMDVCDRTIEDMAKLGNLAPDEVKLISRMQRDLKALPSGRWLWVGGTQWIKDPNNYSGAYNCTSTTLSNWMAFGLIMNLAMMGSGTGAVIEPRYTVKLPVISLPTQKLAWLGLMFQSQFLWLFIVLEVGNNLFLVIIQCMD